MALQSLIQIIYPPQCALCDARVTHDFALCGACWGETRFITGLCCNGCGVPLPGTSDRAEYCDDCRDIGRPWSQGRAALVYDGQGRKLIMALKYGDRIDLGRTVAPWMVRAAGDILQPDSLLVPVPLHWLRLLKRRYNQAAVLAQSIAKITRSEVCEDALIRPQRTAKLDGHGIDARFAALDGALRPHPGRIDHLKGRHVVLIDDVMTSGATFTAATRACLDAGATKISVLALARAVKDV